MNDEVTRTVTLTDENSSVDDVISTLPTSLRLVAQARLTGRDGQIHLRRPLTFDTGLDVTVPVRFEDAFTVRDTADADFSALDDVTDPSNDASVSAAELTVDYTNGVPLGADAQFDILDADGAEVLSLPGEGETIRLGAAPKNEGGTTAGAESGTTTLDLTEDELRTLADGRELVVRLTMEQQEGGPPATVRATDTIELFLETNIEATVGVD